MKMFGNLTRTVKPFYPNRLVCKRFNVRNPHPNHDPTADADVGRSQAGSKDALSKESMESMLNERLPLKFTSSTIEEPISNDPLMNAVIPKPSDRTDKETAPTTGVDKEVKKSENEGDEGPELDYERPSMDIFKAIFDDSEEEEEEEEQNTPMEMNLTTAVKMEQDDFIGPPMPPSAPTLDIPIEKKESNETSSVPFRPMFKRASERKEQDAPLTNIISEEIVVQPFKPRSSNHKRRRVSVSEEDEEEEKRERSSSKHHHKSSRRSRSRDHKHKYDRKSRSDKSKYRSSSSRKRSRSRSPEERRHKSSKKSKKERSSSSRKEEDYYDYEAMWVEKEPVIPLSDSSKSKKAGRMSAADMWS